MSIFRFIFFLTTQNILYFVALKEIFAVLVYIGIQKSHHVKVMFYRNIHNINLFLFSAHVY